MTIKEIRWHKEPMMAMPRCPSDIATLETIKVAMVYPKKGVMKIKDTTVLERLKFSRIYQNQHTLKHRAGDTYRRH